MGIATRNSPDCPFQRGEILSFWFLFVRLWFASRLWADVCSFVCGCIVRDNGVGRLGLVNALLMTFVCCSRRTHMHTRMTRGRRMSQVRIVFASVAV